jgi:hypothetical protein
VCSSDLDIIDSKYDISVQDAVDKEGFDYALVGYHDWKGVKDIKFQTLYENYIKSRKSLSEYVDIFENYEDGGYMANGDYMADGGNLHAKYIAYIEESRRPGGSDRSIKKTYNLDVEDRTSDGFYVIGAKEDIEDFINDYSINFAKIELYKEDGGMMAKGGKTSGLVTITTDAYFGGDGIKDVKEHISNIEKKFKIEIKPTGQLNNDATQEYNITGKKKDILKFLADDSFDEDEFGMGFSNDEIEEFYPELFEDGGYMAKGGMIVAQKTFDINDNEVSEDIYEFLLDYTSDDFELSEEDQYAIRSEDPERVIDIMNDGLIDYEVVSRYDDDKIRLKIIKKTKMADGGYMAKGGFVIKYTDPSGNEETATNFFGNPYIFETENSAKLVMSSNPNFRDDIYKNIKIVPYMVADGGETMNQGVYPANFFDGPNPTNLYALMQLDIDTGYGSLVDGRIYTINEAFKLADELNENIDNYDKKIEIFTVEQLLKRKSLPKTSKDQIYENYKDKKNLIDSLIERFGKMDWQKEFKYGGYMAKGGETKEFIDWDKIIGKKVNGWEARDNNGISILWENDNSPYWFYATPGWENEKNLPIQIVGDGGDFGIAMFSKNKDASYKLNDYLMEIKEIIRIINFKKPLSVSDFKNSFSKVINNGDSFKKGGYMAKGGMMSDEKMTLKLQKEFEDKDLFDDEIVDEYVVKQFDYSEDSDNIEKFIRMKKNKFYVVPFDNQDDSYYYILVPKDKMNDGGMMAKGGKLKSNAAKFRDKVKAISKKLTGTKVPKKYKKDYGATYDKQEANTAARRISGAKLAELRAKLAKKTKTKRK